ncbi:MAG: DUF1559 domain-containing protein, partial [Pirellulales bacterium]
NLKQFGIAALNYHDQLKTFPAGACNDWVNGPQNAAHVYASPHAMLLPYFEEASLHNLYNQKVAWFFQFSQVADRVIPVFVCPSYSGENPIEDTVLNNVLLFAFSKAGPPPRYYDKGQQLGVTTYSFCKGVTDAWCFGGGKSKTYAPPGPPWVPAGDRGMFDINWAVPIRKITDGTSKTIAAGESTGGLAWPVAAAINFASRDPRDPLRWKNFGVDGSGLLRNATCAWIIAEPSFDPLGTSGRLVGSTVTACTLEPMNKNPVSTAYANVPSQGITICDKSLPGAPGTKDPQSCPLAADGVTGQQGRCGRHVTPNFRSDHPGGCNFLFADGSVHYLGEDINMLTYQQLSTMAGNDVVEIPE